MREKEFNLIEEGWIRVIDKKCNVTEVSLIDAFLNSHKYIGLSGETSSQDIAILRLLLAILHTVFFRMNVMGEDNPIKTEKDAYERWNELWQGKQLPAEPIKRYLEMWKERFWLFHPERPFYQIAGLDYGTKYGAAKLNGELSESSNKTRFFSSYAGSEKTSLNYAQAARWLLYVNAFDDNSGKPSKIGKEQAQKSGRKMGVPGVGWLGKLGLIIIDGDTLFETLLLNMVMVQEEFFLNEEKPTWELQKISTLERRKIAVPDNLSELYTLQSRKVSLIRENDRVVGYRLLGGDFFNKEAAKIEPMTVWRAKETKLPVEFSPKRHDYSQQMWRDFSSIFGLESKDETLLPGVIQWNIGLVNGKYIPFDTLLKTSIVSVQFGDSDYFVKHAFSDSLSLQRGVVSEKGRKWQNYIIHEIENCDHLAEAIGKLYGDLYLASGGDTDKRRIFQGKAKEQMYFRLDAPFRKWLRSINVDDIDHEKEKKQEWRNEAKMLGYNYADELVKEAGERALIGKEVLYAEGKKVHYSSPRAFNIFQSTIHKIYKEVKKDDRG